MNDFQFFLNQSITVSPTYSDYINVYGSEKLLLTLAIGAVSGTLPQLDIAVMGTDKAGFTFEINNFITKFLGDANTYDFLEVDLSNFERVRIKCEPSGTLPDFSITMKGYIR